MFVNYPTFVCPQLKMPHSLGPLPLIITLTYLKQFRTELPLHFKELWQCVTRLKLDHSLPPLAILLCLFHKYVYSNILLTTWMSCHASYIIASASRASLATRSLLTHPHFHKPSACGMIFPDDKPPIITRIHFATSLRYILSNSTTTCFRNFFKFLLCLFCTGLRFLHLQSNALFMLIL